MGVHVIVRAPMAGVHGHHGAQGQRPSAVNLDGQAFVGAMGAMGAMVPAGDRVLRLAPTETTWTT